MPKRIISMVSGGIVDHFRSARPLKIGNIDARGLFFVITVIMYIFSYLISFRLLEEDERGTVDLEFYDDENENYERLRASKAENAGDKPDSEEKEKSDSQSDH
ncbi:hypothetical protein C922_04490 [Plasmodium inui San Antonio 1]|uniref:Uncharacterized protein n=1 Tax=Plasmodium inui San Antonio 1 TaxID=1237626 RepID=W7A0J5_9APIC|nr:hypothetical protein C922_04490 [Plasmodium inui San Antonio 1]EUD65090.1 hypothetical protein C922_04490 [Plasmodium inui San Antonio 1]